LGICSPAGAPGIEHGHSPRRRGLSGGIATGDRVTDAPNGHDASIPSGELLALVHHSLDDDKAIEPVSIDLAGKTTLADWMVVATGTSQRHISSMADKLIERLKAAGITQVSTEGMNGSDWVLIDIGDVIVHLFRAETRAFYDLEKLWSVVPPRRAAAGGAA
jgi:ribosome-associated protein